MPGSKEGCWERHNEQRLVEEHGNGSNNMLTHFTKMALKAFLRFKMHSLISLISLVFGFFCFITAGLLADYVDSFDQDFPNSGNIYNILQIATAPEAPFDNFPIVHEPAARYLKAAFPELQHVVRTTMSTNTDITFSGRTDSFAVRYVDAEFFDIFPIPLLHGTASSASLPPNSMLITRDAAMRRFGSTDVVGQIATLNNQHVVSIAGVVDEFDFPTHLDSSIPLFRTDIFVPSEVYDILFETGATAGSLDPLTDQWDNQSYYVYLQFPKGTLVNTAQFDERLQEFVTTTIPPPHSDVMTYGLQPVNRLITSMLAIFTQGFNIVSILQVAGALVLLIGCLNYSNLVIAQLSLRSQEIAVQKILGPKRGLLIVQYCYESLLFVGLALLITLLGFAVLLSSIENAGYAGAGPALLLSPSLWSTLLVVIAVIVMIAGLYPAVRTATVRLVTLMRPKGSSGYSGSLRSLMVGTQFLISGTLMILAIVMFNQNATMTAQLDGNVADPKIVISVPLDTLDLDADLLINELQRHAGVLSTTRIDQQPWQLGMSPISVSREPDINATTIDLVNHYVGYDFAETLDIPQVAGRGFARERSADELPPSSELVQRGGPYALILDTVAVRTLGFASAEEALGQSVYRHISQRGTEQAFVVEQTVVGIVGKQKFQFVDYSRFGVGGDMYTLRPDNATFLIIRIAKNNIAETLVHIEEVWQRLIPDTPIKRVFADELFYETYQLFLAMGSAIGGLSVVGFLIASIGLLGNATFITNIRQKEVGIRKVMGASSNRLLAMLLFDFAKPVIIANAIAWPLGYVIASVYISLFSARTEITIMPFLISFLLSVLIAVAAVVSQSWKSARVRPAMTLRYE